MTPDQGTTGDPRRSGPGRPARPGSGSRQGDARSRGNGGASGRGGARPGGRDGKPRREDARLPRDVERPKPEAPPIPPEVKYEDLDKEVRSRLRSLSKGNAEDIGRHIMMVGLLIDEEPETAYLHAQVAVSRGGRVDVVREVAALAAYATGRYAEALRELRTVRRLSGSVENLAMEADCERGLGRPERAVALTQTPEAGRLSPAAAVEMQIVLAGARLDMGDPGAALLALQRVVAPDEESAARVREATVDALRALGRDDDAEELASTLPEWEDEAAEDAEEIVVYDLEEEAVEDVAEEK